VKAETDGNAIRYRAVVPQESKARAPEEQGGIVMDAFVERFGAHN
jgi:hypothetical protein